MLLDTVLELVAAVVPLPAGGERRARRRARAFEAGEVVVFEGAALGALPYCRPAIGFLSASPGTLAISPTASVDFHRRPIPLARMELVEVRDRRPGDPEAVRRWWRVAECRDGGESVAFACAPADMELLATTLRAPAATG